MISLLLVAASFILIYRLYGIQVSDYAIYAEEAVGQQFKMILENPKRGAILDSNNVELAGTTYVYRIGVTPKDVYSLSKDIDTRTIAASIADCLEMDADEVYAVLLQEDKTYVQLKKDVPREQADALKAYKASLQIGGIAIDAEPRRYYTTGMLASQVIGYTNYNAGNLVGQLGIEMAYNDILTGEPGYTYVETDNNLYGELPFSVPTSLQARDGQNIVLNIDINIQKIVQEELESAIKANDIEEGGTVIVVNPYTGAVLAMASYPYFSSSDPTGCPEGLDESAWNGSDAASIEYLTSTVWRNRAISDSFEPGSTMKAVTAAIALEEGLTDEQEVMSDSSLRLLGWTISCAHAGGHGMETMQQGFWRSCNPIFAQLALRTGIEKFYDYIRAFGFVGITGVDLPAESTGILHTDPTELDMATLSYGESSTVTPIQMVSAYCVFANGGKLIEPMLVKAVTNAGGDITREIQPQTVRQVISEDTAARIRELLKGVVLYGTGTAAYVEGYAVAGKTSTSTADDGYHTLSFAGIAPADNPEIVTLVVLNKPSDKDLTSKAAAAASGRIISRTLEYLGIARQYTDQDVSRLAKSVSVPDVTGMTYDNAVRTLKTAGLDAMSGSGNLAAGTTVEFQWPAFGTELHDGGLVVLYDMRDPEQDLAIVPDFTGKNVSECLSAAREAGLNIRIEGDCLGFASGQDPAPTYGTASDSETDSRLNRGSIITIRFATIEEVVASLPETD